MYDGDGERCMTGMVNICSGFTLRVTFRQASTTRRHSGKKTTHTSLSKNNFSSFKNEATPAWSNGLPIYHHMTSNYVFT